jgi:hypothetical protein
LRTGKRFMFSWTKHSRASTKCVGMRRAACLGRQALQECAFRGVLARGVLLLLVRPGPIHAIRWEIPLENLRGFRRLRDSRRGFGRGRACRGRREFRQECRGFCDDAHGTVVARAVHTTGPCFQADGVFARLRRVNCATTKQQNSMRWSWEAAGAQHVAPLQGQREKRAASESGPYEAASEGQKRRAPRPAP